jgi:hypothetical protein
LPEVEANGVLDGLDAKEIREGAEVLHGKVKLEFGNEGLYGGLIVSCDNNIIDIDLEKNLRAVSVINK